MRREAALAGILDEADGPGAGMVGGASGGGFGAGVASHSRSGSPQSRSVTVSGDLLGGGGSGSGSGGVISPVSWRGGTGPGSHGGGSKSSTGFGGGVARNGASRHANAMFFAVEERADSGDSVRGRHSMHEWERSSNRVSIVGPAPEGCEPASPSATVSMALRMPVAVSGPLQGPNQSQDLPYPARPLLTTAMTDSGTDKGEVAVLSTKNIPSLPGVDWSNGAPVVQYEPTHALLWEALPGGEADGRFSEAQASSRGTSFKPTSALSLPGSVEVIAGASQPLPVENSAFSGFSIVGG
jgi:hypothetical protein